MNQSFEKMQLFQTGAQGRNNPIRNYSCLTVKNIQNKTLRRFLHILTSVKDSASNFRPLKIYSLLFGWIGLKFPFHFPVESKNSLLWSDFN